MGLSEVQRTLALLLTNAELRDRLRAGTESANAVAAELGLNAADMAQVQHFAMAELERSARSLHAKRWQEIQKLLPLSLKAASLPTSMHTVGGNSSNGSGPGDLPSPPGRAKNPLFRLFTQFVETYVPGGSKRHANDAIAFANWVNEHAQVTPENLKTPPLTPPRKRRGELSPPASGGVSAGNGGSLCPPWLPDLLRYEATWLRLHIDTRPRFLHVERYRYPVPKIATALAQTNPTLGKLAAKPILVCWLRLSPKTNIRMMHLF